MDCTPERERSYLQITLLDNIIFAVKVQERCWPKTKETKLVNLISLGVLKGHCSFRGMRGGSSGKKPACQCRRQTGVQSLGLEDPLEEGLAAHSSILAWRIPWREEPGGLQSMRLQRVGHD